MTKSRWVAITVAAVLVAAVIVFWQARGDDDASPAPKASAPTSAAAEPSRSVASARAPRPSGRTTAPGASSKPREVELDATVPIDRGADARIVSIEKVTSQAKGPGEISGPALRVTFEVAAGSKPVGVADLSVNAYFGPQRVPAISMTRPGADPFSGTIKAGRTARGVYVFNVPKSQRKDVTIELFYAADRPAVRFRGAA